VTCFSVQVPIGTIIKSSTGKVVGDLKDEGTMFVAARGGAGGHGNHFFISDTVQAPKIAECGAQGEDLQYMLEVRSMAHIGLVMIRLMSTYTGNKLAEFVHFLKFSFFKYNLKQSST
jgi:GTPase involved in cell partitioning and DNA repair